MKSVLIINLEVKDNHEEAAVGARLALELCQEVRILVALQYYNKLCFLTLRTNSNWVIFMCRLKQLNRGRSQLMTYWLLLRNSIGENCCIVSLSIETVSCLNHISLFGSHFSL